MDEQMTEQTIEQMTEQQQHLVNLINQRQSLATEIEALQGQFSAKRETFFKVQGAIEYLTQIGVTVPEPEATETEEAPAEETAAE
jgi:hypothetical protein